MTDKKAYDITHDRSGATLADLLQQAADQLKQKDIQIAEMKPKALFADAVATSNRSILVGELAKLIRRIWMKSRLKILSKLLVMLNDIQRLPQKLSKR
ncbi:phage antirepressor KilAC domain-containing protein [Lactobacillus iners]